MLKLPREAPCNPISGLQWVHYPNIASINEETQDFEMNLGTIFVPEGYIPKKPGIVNPDIADQISDQFPDDMKLQGEITQTSGDLAERYTYLIKLYNLMFFVYIIKKIFVYFFFQRCL